MAIFLDEQMVGSDAALIGFPRLILCMGVVVLMDDGTLVGAHFTTGESEQDLLRLLAIAVRDHGGAKQELYCVADLESHFRGGGSDIHGKANGLGFTGQGYVADLGLLNPTQGTYAQVASNGAGNRAIVRCKLDQHMDYITNFKQGPAVKMHKTQTKPAVDGGFFKHTSIVTLNSDITASAVKGGQDMYTPFLKPVLIA